MLGPYVQIDPEARLTTSAGNRITEQAKSVGQEGVASGLQRLIMEVGSCMHVSKIQHIPALKISRVLA